MFDRCAADVQRDIIAVSHTGSGWLRSDTLVRHHAILLLLLLSKLERKYSPLDIHLGGETHKQRVLRYASGKERPGKCSIPALGPQQPKQNELPVYLAVTQFGSPKSPSRRRNSSMFRRLVSTRIFLPFVYSQPSFDRRHCLGYIVKSLGLPLQPGD